MSAEQDLATANVQIANLISEVTRFRDAAMGLNAIYPTITEGRQAVADGKYFSVPGNGAYMRLYRRQGSSAELIAEFPDRTELNSVIDQLGPLLGRGVTAGFDPEINSDSLVRVRDAVYYARSNYGQYLTTSSSGAEDFNLDEVDAGFCGLISLGIPGTFPVDAPAFVWVETQRIYGSPATLMRMYPYGGNNAPRMRCWTRISSNSLDSEGKRRWSDWSGEYNTQNILNAVGISNGVPTGGIIERGENANGWYTKFADGTAILQSRAILDLENTTGDQTFDFPISVLGEKFEQATYLTPGWGASETYRSFVRNPSNFYFGAFAGRWRIRLYNSPPVWADPIFTTIARWR